MPGLSSYKPPSDGPRTDAGAKGPNEKYCVECGAIIRAAAEICPKCGVRQPGLPGTAIASGRNRTVAALFALLLGWMGVHKFYLGQTTQGVLYLLFCWTGVPLIIAIIESIVLFSMSDAAFQQKYG